MGGRQYVVFDLETSGLSHKRHEIIQIGAKYQSIKFSRYIVPEYGICPGASAKNHLEVEDGYLFYKGRVVEDTPLEDAIDEFLEFLSNAGHHVILVGHNAFNFDVPFLENAVKRLGMWDEFCSVVDGYADTLPLFKERLPNVKSFSMESLAEMFGVDDRGAHNARRDCEILHQLIRRIGLTKQDIVRSARLIY